MKKAIALGCGVALTMGAALPAFADSANWDNEKTVQVAINRCANAGGGNGGEIVKVRYRKGSVTVVCRTSPRLAESEDRDPGNSTGHNQAG